jgi:hypothetical protein
MSTFEFDPDRLISTMSALGGEIDDVRVLKADDLDYARKTLEASLARIDLVEHAQVLAMDPDVAATVKSQREAAARGEGVISYHELQARFEQDKI